MRLTLISLAIQQERFRVLSTILVHQGTGFQSPLDQRWLRKKINRKKRCLLYQEMENFLKDLFGKLVHQQANINWIISLSLLIEIICKLLVKQKMLIQLNLQMRNLNLLVLTQNLLMEIILLSFWKYFKKFLLLLINLARLLLILSRVAE